MPNGAETISHKPTAPNMSKIAETDLMGCFIPRNRYAKSPVANPICAKGNHHAGIQRIVEFVTSHVSENMTMRRIPN